MSSLIVFPAAIFLEGKTQGLHAEGCIFCTDNRYISSIHQQIHSHGITLILDEEHHKMRDSKTTPPPHPPPKRTWDEPGSYHHTLDGSVWTWVKCL